MTKDPEKRISAEEALKHEWIQNAPSTEVNSIYINKYISYIIYIILKKYR